ncbi:hypothetical protein WMY93_011979 [Mugilogobius chulae]|uniref:Uncharacterized protein n=1 Tax=Mugilogobius chulae TaxID=88201 RepID=A0AAW0PA98_9GOBI
MQNVLKTVDILVSEQAFDSWSSLFGNSSTSAISSLLKVLENLSASLEGDFSISTPHILLNRSCISTFNLAHLSSSDSITITDSNQTNVSITAVTFSTLGRLMPSQALSSSQENSIINADVILVKVNQSLSHELSVRFKKKDTSRARTICV